MSEFIKASNEYADMFGDCIPMAALRGMTEEEAVEVMRDCIKTGEPYKFTYEDGALY